jgi:hypothetical protein
MMDGSKTLTQITVGSVIRLVLLVQAKDLHNV